MTQIDPTAVRLGKKAGVVEDPRTFKLAQLLDTTDLPPVMKEWRIAVKLRDWPMFANDRYGCCVFATHAHRVMAQEWSSGRRDPLPVKTDQVLAFYSDVTGFREDDPSTDNGAYLIDALRFLRKTGFGLETDQSQHTIGAYARVDAIGPTDEFKRAAHLFGGLTLGLALPVRAQGQDVWTDTGRDDWEDKPYSWGGHSVEMIGYANGGITFVTWGREQHATWSWVARYVDEAWALISEDFINRLGRTPQGLDVERLQQLLSAL
jgi:hypothetical protein